jgi:fructose-specific phosphotransferase system IIC component
MLALTSLTNLLPVVVAGGVAIKMAKEILPSKSPRTSKRHKRTSKAVSTSYSSNLSFGNFSNVFSKR